ncbi:hypothetical protein DENSPDRAFT_887208 [Dentipellis sp. KUC8613]|nr:hypothetical protein DENSPDRAFT_887208 [Dentipellis sp. KUC8613]
MDNTRSQPSDRRPSSRSDTAPPSDRPPREGRPSSDGPSSEARYPPLLSPSEEEEFTNLRGWCPTHGVFHFLPGVNDAEPLRCAIPNADGPPIHAHVGAAGEGHNAPRRGILRGEIPRFIAGSGNASAAAPPPYDRVSRSGQVSVPGISLRLRALELDSMETLERTLAIGHQASDALRAMQDLRSLESLVNTRLHSISAQLVQLTSEAARASYVGQWNTAFGCFVACAFLSFLLSNVSTDFLLAPVARK